MTRTTTLWSLLLLSAALALGSCTKDATEQATGPEPEAKAASKLVFSSENAVRGELLVCFGERRGPWDLLCDAEVLEIAPGRRFAD